VTLATGWKNLCLFVIYVLLQRWKGDRIAEERFVYDSAAAWTVVDGA
jgi:hypothetical protein